MGTCFSVSVNTDGYLQLQKLLVSTHLDNNEGLLTTKLQSLVTHCNWCQADLVELFHAFQVRFELSPTNEKTHLLSWMIKVLHSIEIHLISPSLILKDGQTVRQLVKDVTIPEETLLDILSSDKDKELTDILEEIRQQKLKYVDEALLIKVKDTVLTVCRSLESPNGESHVQGLNRTLFLLCLAVKKAKGYKPRLTQMVSWSLMAHSETGWLIQVGTGEGKSCIVAMFAAFRAKEGETVDIMSSSRVLAERDYLDWKPFYGIMGVSVNCNTSTCGCDAALKKCYQCQVVYGPPREFAGDWLSHHFRRSNVRGERQFRCAIVDEADSLMLDRAHVMVYLSSDMPAMEHLNPLLALIWHTVHQYERINSQITVGPEYLFLDIVLENIIGIEGVDKFTVLQMAEDTGILLRGTVHDIQNTQLIQHTSLLCRNIGKNCQVTATRYLAGFFQLVEKKYPSCHFALHVQNDDGTLEELNPRSPDDNSATLQVPLLHIKGGFCRYMYSSRESLISAAEKTVKGFVQFTQCGVTDDSALCHVPGFLAELVNSKLKLWVNNAFTAQILTMDEEYIVEGGGVVPVYYRYTGVVESQMQWSDGLQQFLEIEHCTKMSNMTAITNFMSNFCLFQKYGNRLYGITGTLGSQSEREVFQKLYNGVKTCDIPSFRRRKLFEVNGLLVKEENKWIREICKVVKAQISPTPFRAERAVLVICETINKAKVVYNALGKEISQKMLYINNNCDNSAIFQKKLEAGNVIIATNLAGRGTDLAVSDQVNNAGGLFVVQTFMPPNVRVEQQAFGRTARQGSPGCAQMVVCLHHLSTISQVLLQGLPETNGSGLTIAKIARDVSEANRLSSYVEDDIEAIQKKENLFNRYLVILDEFYKSYSNNPPQSAVDSLNETWGVWLLMHLDEDGAPRGSASRLDVDMKAARAKVAKRQSPFSNLHHYTLFGNDLLEAGKLEESVVMYTKAIQEDSAWAAIALYNRALVVLSQKNREQDESCINRALADLVNAIKSIKLYSRQIKATLTFSDLASINPDHSATSFYEHMRKKLMLLKVFEANVNQAIVALSEARIDSKVIEVKKQPVLSMLIKLGVRVLVQLSDGQQVPMVHIPHLEDFLIELNSLESRGLTHVFTLEPQFSFKYFFNSY